MVITRDSREQAGYAFDSPRYEGVTVISGALVTGDYAPAGLETLCSCERKSMDDLAHCLGQDRQRFVRELERSKALDAFCVVVEGAWADLAAGRYRSRLDPHSAAQSILSFTARLGIPFLFMGSRAAAEYAVWSFCRQYLEGARKRFRRITQAQAA